MSKVTKTTNRLSYLESILDSHGFFIADSDGYYFNKHTNIKKSIGVYEKINRNFLGLVKCPQYFHVADFYYRAFLKPKIAPWSFSIYGKDYLETFESVTRILSEYVNEKVDLHLVHFMMGSAKLPK